LTLAAPALVAAIALAPAVFPGVARADNPNGANPAGNAAAMNNGAGNGAANAVPWPAAPANQATNGNYSGDFPHQEVMAVPMAHAQEAATRWIHWEAESNLQTVVDELRQDIDQSTAMVDAIGQERNAYADFDEARLAVLQKLADDPVYRGTQRLVVQISQAIATQKKADPPTAEDLQRTQAMASLKLSYAANLSAMEAVAMAQDPRVQETHLRLVAAGRALADLRAKENHDVPRDEQFVAAKRAYVDALVAHMASDAYLNSMIEARNIAVDYAYYIHGWDYLKYSAGNGFIGYPFGYPYYGNGLGGGPYYGVTSPAMAVNYPYTVTRR
jgi:hypothetical protein